jgi:hypothetical protein
MRAVSDQGHRAIAEQSEAGEGEAEGQELEQEVAAARIDELRNPYCFNEPTVLIHPRTENVRAPVAGSVVPVPEK